MDLKGRRFSSVAYLELEEDLASGMEIESAYESFIEKVVIMGTIGFNNPYRYFCAFANQMGVSFVRGGREIAYVTYGNDKSLKLCINAVNLVNNCYSEGHIWFIVAHEVSHLLYGHLYSANDYDDEVIHTVLNLVEDCEINETLFRLYKKKKVGEERDYILGNCIRYGSIRDFSHNCPTDARFKRELKEVYSGQQGKPESQILYAWLSNVCSMVLGDDFEGIHYRASRGSISFKESIFKYLETGDSGIFSIYRRIDADYFCANLAKYLNRDYGIGGDGIPEGLKGEVSELVDAINASVISSYGDDITDDITDGFDRGIGSKSSISATGLGRATIPWNVVLNNRVKLLFDKLKPTKNRLNRRQPHRLDLHGSIKAPEKGRIVVCIDESGSVSNTQRSKFLGEVYSIIKNYDFEVDLVRFTSEVCEFKAISNLSELTSIIYERYSGGTSFSPIFSYLNSKLKSSAKRSCLVLILTDGMGERVVDFKGFRNRLWVICGESKLSCKEELCNIYYMG